MERKIGETFDYDGHKLVVETVDSCNGCYFNEKETCGAEDCGICSSHNRSDGQEVIFKEYKTENKEDMETNEKTMPVPDGWEFDRIDVNGNIVLKEKKKELPKTWLECLRIIDHAEYIKEDSEIDICHIDDFSYKDGLYDYNGRNMLPRGLGKPMLALCQLLVCRNAWWKQLGWKPDWKDNDIKYCIGFYKNEIARHQSAFANYILAFPSPEVRDQFFDTFRDLIEEAKELL